MDEKEKAIACYQFIQKLCALKYKTITDIRKQDWVQYLRELPDDPDNISVAFRDRTEEESEENSAPLPPLLTVHKPEFGRCPEPPAIIAPWLEPGWERYPNEVHIRNASAAPANAVPGQRPGGVSATPAKPDQFGDVPERVRALQGWKTRRAEWAARQRRIQTTRAFFTALFQQYTDLTRESETLEMLVGNGILRENGGGAVSHPVLLKRVRLQFDAKKNTLCICDADTDSELYAELLDGLQGIDHSAVKKAEERLRNNDYHPLDRNDTPDFFKVLTHSLSSDSRYLVDPSESVTGGDRLVMTWDPVFFVRKRTGGEAKAMQSIIQNIEQTGYMPGFLRHLVSGGTAELPLPEGEPTVEEQLAASCGESLPILFAKEANREQLEIAQRIEQYNAVLVQGPPGTGKTHTIANLMGHFLAQGKTVLVASQTRKALSVLKEKVPAEIRDLCVSVLDDTNADMVRSVDGITEFMSRHTSADLKQQMDADARRRAEIFDRLAEVRRRLYAIRYRECQPIVLDGESYSPAQAAGFVNAHAECLGCIPGRVSLYHPLPVPPEQLALLYRSNAELTAEEERELRQELPALETLSTPSAFAKLTRRADECQKAIAAAAEKLGVSVSADPARCVLTVKGLSGGEMPLVSSPKADTLQALAQMPERAAGVEDWMLCAAADGRRGGGYRQRWERLADSLEEAASCADGFAALYIGAKVTIVRVNLPQDLPEQLEKSAQLFRKKGKISKLDLLINRGLENVLLGVRVNGHPLSSERDCRLAQESLALAEKREAAAPLWDELMAKHGAPAFSLLGDTPEQIGQKYVPVIRRYLSWFEEEFDHLRQLVDGAGIQLESLFAESELENELAYAARIRDAIAEQLPLYLMLARQLLQLQALEAERCKALELLSGAGCLQSSICRGLAEAVRQGDSAGYERGYAQLVSLYGKTVLKTFREQTLALIEPVAPDWAAAIRNREGIHGGSCCPQNIGEVWKCRQFAGIVDSLVAEPFETLQRESVRLSEELREATAKLAADSAWYRLLLRTEGDVDMRQALRGWEQTIKKIGKGTGKNAPALKKRARELMAKCQTAVPAWIMTVGGALESLDPVHNRFDVVIIDEASQSDLSAFGIAYLAKKTIIVGDDQQVSPLAVGVDAAKVAALQAMYIKDIIPNWQLYDAKASLYGIAYTTFQPLMLREHFRCHPDIIGYSNRLSYDYKIKPLRSAGSCSVSPAVIFFRVADGMRDGIRKVNFPEAKSIAALMLACMEQMEYAGMTFGAISLLGDEQAEIIQQELLRHMDSAVFEQRRVLCGDASYFQGDERDIVFLSMVDSNEGDGPLRMAGEGADQSRKQRYNVAASRAREQLWVVHSLDYKTSLKPGDLRRDLLEYAENPKAFALAAEAVEKTAESPFEEAVGKALLAAGYRIAQQWPVGAYRIDIVVSCGEKSIAIECDGDAYHSGEEKLRTDMERQTILERIGWRFVRIRGSEYFRDPEKTMERVRRELEELGIFPEPAVQTASVQPASALLERVKIRAAQLLNEWEKERCESDVLPNVIALPPPKRPGPLPADAESKAGTFEQTSLFPTAWPDPSNNRAEAAVRNSQKLSVRMPQPTAVACVRQHAEAHTTAAAAAHKAALPSAEENLLHAFDTAGIRYIDNRVQSGIIWVLKTDEEVTVTEGILREYGRNYSFEKRGAIATGNRPAWRIMPQG